MPEESEDPLVDFDQTNGRAAGVEGRPDLLARREDANRRVRFINQIIAAIGRRR